MDHHTDLIDIVAIGLALAFVFGFLANRMKLPPLVGYLFAGIVVGPFTPGFVGDAGMATQLAEIGVMLLMFGVGLHFSLDDLLEVKTIAIPGAVAQISVATLMGLGLAWAIGWNLAEGLVFGLALSVASTVVLLRALEERRLLDSKRGKIAIGWLIVEDLAMVLTLVLLPPLGAALAGDGELDAGRIAGKLGLTLLQVAGFVAVMLVIGRRMIPWVMERSVATGSRELFTLSVLAIALGIAFGSAALFGVSFALGAFFAGMLLNESELSHKAANDSLPLRDAFAVLFFVSVGMLFDPAVVLERPLQVLATAFIILIGKSAAAYVIVRAFGHAKNTALTISASLAQIGEFSFILAGLGVSLNILPPEGRDLILAGALISIVANPLMFRLLDRWQARQLAAQAALAAQADQAAEAQASAQAAQAVVEPVEPPPGPVLQGDDHAIVIGYGQVGAPLVQLLRDRGVPVQAIEMDPDLVRRARDQGVPTIRGNAVSERVLAEAQPDKARIVVIAIPNALEAGEIVTRLRAANPQLTIFARAHSEAEAKHLIEHGADGTVMAERELAFSMAEMVMSMPPYRSWRESHA